MKRYIFVGDGWSDETESRVGVRACVCVVATVIWWLGGEEEKKK